METSDTSKIKEVFRIVEKETGTQKGAYWRSYYDKFDFQSPQDARSANVHDTFEDRSKYRIDKYRVIYELIDPDCDGSHGEDRDVKILKFMIKHRNYLRWCEPSKDSIEAAEKDPSLKERLGMCACMGGINCSLRSDWQKLHPTESKITREEFMRLAPVVNPQ